MFISVVLLLWARQRRKKCFYLDVIRRIYCWCFGTTTTITMCIWFCSFFLHSSDPTIETSQINFILRLQCAFFFFSFFLVYDYDKVQWATMCHTIIALGSKKFKCILSFGGLNWIRNEEIFFIRNLCWVVGTIRYLPCSLFDIR